MDTYTFQLRVVDPIDIDTANQLIDEGVDDAVTETGPQGHFVGFDRDSESLASAVLSAISDVEAAGLVVVSMSPEDLVSAADIAERTGRSRQSVSTLISGDRGPGGWPAPVAGNVRSPLWRWVDVAEWLETCDGVARPVERDTARFVAAINAALATRHALHHLAGPIRDQVRALVL